jgi:hypothetical protein
VCSNPISGMSFFSRTSVSRCLLRRETVLLATRHSWITTNVDKVSKILQKISSERPRFIVGYSARVIAFIITIPTIQKFMAHVSSLLGYVLCLIAAFDL